MVTVILNVSVIIMEYIQCHAKFNYVCIVLRDILITIYHSHLLILSNEEGRGNSTVVRYIYIYGYRTSLIDNPSLYRTMQHLDRSELASELLATV